MTSRGFQVWYQNTFTPSATNIESLDRVIRSDIDFAILVITTDDFRDRDAGARVVPRDNVVFELGLCMGRLGRSRTFGLVCSHCEVELPTDLLGVSWVMYRHPHEQIDQAANRVDALDLIRVALSDAVRQILRAVAADAPSLVSVPGAADLVKTYPMRGMVGRFRWNEIIRDATRHIWLYGMRNTATQRTTRCPTYYRRPPRWPARSECYWFLRNIRGLARSMSTHPRRWSVSSGAMEGF